MEEKTILLEVYKQECENVRFFEDLKTKMHYFAFSGLFIILGFYWKNISGSNEGKYLLFFGSLMFIITLVIILTFKAIQRSHNKRMIRLSKVVDKLNLCESGSNIYKAKYTTKRASIESIIYIPYVLFLIFWFLIVANIILLCMRIF